MSKIKFAAFFIAICLFNTAPAMAAKCVSWDLPQTIAVQQVSGPLVHIYFTTFPPDAQKDGTVGQASYVSENGAVDGDVFKLQYDGRHIDFKIKWKNSNATGIYSGSMDSRGAEGITYDKKIGPTGQVRWYIDPEFPCALKEGQDKKAEAAYKKQREDELQVTGKSPRECETSNQSCEARFKSQIPYPASIGVIAKECQPYFQQCMANAIRRQVNEGESKKIRDNETQVTGRNPEQCQTAFYSCRTRVVATFGKLKGFQETVKQCEPYRLQCLTNAAAAQPNNGGGGGGGSLVTVLQSVDVYDSPGGDGQKIGNLRKGSKVSVDGDCTDSWCHVLGRRVPNGEGYVYNGDDYKSLDF